MITDASGLALPNVKVVLAGSANLTRFTDASGAFAFSGLASGSYSVKPTLTGCTFVPDVVNLNNLTQSAVQNFPGSGASCGGSVKVNYGATAGAFTISGQVVDGTGTRVVGARVDLGGTTNAVRFTDMSGRYTFHVGTGSYTLAANGACPLTPTSAAFNNLNGSRTQNFTTSSTSCTTAQVPATGPMGQYVNVSQGTTRLGFTVVQVIPYASASVAQAHVQALLQQPGAVTRSLTIAGNPAVEVQQVIPGAELELPPPNGGEPEDSLGLTTATSVGSTFVRFESRLASDATQATIDAFTFAGRNFGSENLASFHGPTPPSVPTTQTAPPLPPPPILVAPGEVYLGDGEIQIAASDSTGAVVIGTQAVDDTTTPTLAEYLFYSKDGGKTTAASSWSLTIPPDGAAGIKLGGDPAIATGPFDSTINTDPFYFVNIFGVTAAANAQDLPRDAIGISVSRDDGAHFAQLPVPTSCSASAANVAFPINCSTTKSCLVPDQPFIAVDKKNRANVAGQSYDQLYLTWRNSNFTASNRLALTPALACSNDGGCTWKTDYTSIAVEGADHPRSAVALDGSVYVVYQTADGMDQRHHKLLLNKFSSCSNGFMPVGGSYPIPLASFVDPAAMGGMPRQPGSNFWISTSDTSAASVFVTYSTESSAGNDDVHLVAITDGTPATTQDFILNTSSNGHRFFPAVCAAQGDAFVAWYDRRAGDDRTAYFRRTLVSSGNTLAPEHNITGAGFEDPECLVGYPGGGVSDSDAELLCTDLPTTNNLNTGLCARACNAGESEPCGSQQACDLRPGTPGNSCPSGETCGIPFSSGISPGTPVFGDYNGIGCAAGQAFVGWLSTTGPQGGCTMRGDLCTTNEQCCSGACSPSVDGSGSHCGSASATACAEFAQPCATNADCCSLSCQGGVCFRKAGLFLAGGGKTTIVHVDGTIIEHATRDSGMTETYTQSFSEDVTLGAFGTSTTTGGFESGVSAPGTSFGAFVDFGLKLEGDNTTVRVAGEAFSFGPASVNIDTNDTGAELHPGSPVTITNNISSSLPPDDAPYVSGDMSFSVTLTTRQEW